MIDVVTVGAGGGSIAWLSPEGTLKVGPQSAGADPGPLCYGKGGTEVDHHRRPRRARPDPAAPARRRDPARRRRGPRRASRRSPRSSGSTSEALRHRRPGDLRLEPGQRAAPGHRQARPRRPRLHADHVRRLRLAAAVPADGHPRHRRRCWCRPNPGNVSAFGLLTVDVKNDYVQTHVARHDRARRRRPSQAILDALDRPGAARRWPRRASPPTQHQFAAHRRPALLRPGLRGAGRRCPRAPSTPARSTRSPTRFHAEHRALYGYDFRGDPTQQVEWVNLRVSGIGPITPAGDPDAARGPVDGAAPPAAPATRPVCFDADARVRRHPGRLARRPRRRATPSPGPAIIEEFGSTVPVHPGFEVAVDEYLNLIVTSDRGGRA